jgi:hypothetical protein
MVTVQLEHADVVNAPNGMLRQVLIAECPLLLLLRGAGCKAGLTHGCSNM